MCVHLYISMSIYVYMSVILHPKLKTLNPDNINPKPHTRNRKRPIINPKP